MNVRISSFDEMPYDSSLLDELRGYSETFEAGPRRDAFRVLYTCIMMDIHRGGVLRRVIVEPILKELESLLGEDHSEMSKLITLTGYLPTENERMDHARHDPFDDRWDDCPLCWADVISDEQRDWLSGRGQKGEGNSIARTCGMIPLNERNER